MLVPHPSRGARPTTIGGGSGSARAETIPPWRFPPSFVSQWLIQLDRLYILGAENAWQIILLLENVGGDVMLDVEVSPMFTSQQHNTDDRDSPALELHVISAVDWSVT